MDNQTTQRQETDTILQRNPPQISFRSSMVSFISTHNLTNRPPYHVSPPRLFLPQHYLNLTNALQLKQVILNLDFYGHIL